MDLACRSCRVPLMADAKGCAICRGIRNHLVILDAEKPDGHPSLASVSQEMVKFLRDRHEYLRAELAMKPGSEALAKQAISNVNAMTKLLEAARRLQGDGLAAVEAMSFLERAKLFIQWYGSLPPTYRGRVREMQAQWETERSVPAAPTVQLLPPGE